jgi:hypothetical protein
MIGCGFIFRMTGRRRYWEKEVGRAVLCTPFTARTHSTSLRAGWDGRYLPQPEALIRAGVLECARRSIGTALVSSVWNSKIRHIYPRS